MKWKEKGIQAVPVLIFAACNWQDFKSCNYVEALNMIEKGKILVVDDNVANLEILAYSLRDAGYSVTLVDNGKSALNLLGEESFDLLLLDIIMPEMDGYEVCRQVRQGENKDLPVIFLTARSDRESVIRGFEAGAQDYISKPFDSGELIARVNTHVQLFQSRKVVDSLNMSLEREVEKRTTELKDANLALEEANESLKDLDTAKMEFLGIISHEIRTPLNSIKGFAELLRKELQNEENQMFSEMILESAARLEEFTSLAMDITSLKLKRYKLRHTEFPLQDVIDIALKRNEAKIEEKNITVDIQSNLTSTMITGELILINKVIGIVTENAVKHTFPGTTIKISSTNEKGFLNVVFRDRGEGFHNSILKNGIQPFDSGQQHVNKNMALHLTLAKLIMISHLGYIDIANYTDGAEVILRFPCRNNCKGGILNSPGNGQVTSVSYPSDMNQH